MNGPIGTGEALRNAFRVAFKNLGISLFISLICGGLGAVVAFYSARVLADVFQTPNKQQLLIVTQLGQQLVVTIWGCIIGSWAAPTQIYLWVAEAKGKPASLYDAVNYGLNRFRRVLPAHALALFLFQLGWIIIVPGILFGLQNAYVDAIATLDTEEKRVLTRSRALVAIRRGTVFRTLAVFALWWTPYVLVGTFYAQNLGALATAALGTVDHFVLLLIDLAMVQLYLDLFKKRAAAEA